MHLYLSRRVSLLMGGAAFALTLLLLLTAGAPLPAQAQARTYATQYHAWLAVNAEPRFSERWGVRGELILRRADEGREWQQVQFRVAPIWNPRPDLQLSVGYLFSRTLPYGAFPVAGPLHEDRLYEQLLLRTGLGRVGVVHRYRLEQRWNHPAVASDPARRTTVYTNRVRYQPRVVLPLRAGSAGAPGPFVAGSAEVFVSFGRHVARNIFDQFRGYGGFGWQLTSATAVELGYLHQLIGLGDGVRFERNHTLQLTVNLSPIFAAPTTLRPEIRDNGE